ncbi:MAG TPA: thermonuclease family protein [Solimonas sp.]
MSLRPVLLALLFCIAPLRAHSSDCSHATVLWVHDGDTLGVSCGSGKPVKIRVADIDAPELEQAYGLASRDALASRVQGQHVILHPRARDRYGRTVATIELDGRDVGLQLVADGLAWCGMRPSSNCREALQEVQRRRLGLWADVDPQPPWQWRRQHPQRH